jgi:NAD(P)-dependent dehydrogenase (short-subunit alcohol dehydrogenase family)
MTIAGKIWFITGISRGFGREIANAVLAEGGIVIGTAREGTADIDPRSGELHVLPLDVTDATEVRATVARAHAIHGRLDVVVNNAGYGLIGAIEESTGREARHLFDVNFFGALEVIQAVLPLLRAQRSGHIVNLSSIAGLAAAAGAGLYAASKFALEGLSQSLAQEVAPLGIKVTVVEPGSFRTDFLSERSIRKTEHPIADYATTAGALVARLGQFSGRQPGDPVRAVRAIIAAVESETPPLHLVLGADALSRTREKLQQFTEELARWEALTLSTDFQLLLQESYQRDL